MKNELQWRYWKHGGLKKGNVGFIALKIQKKLILQKLRYAETLV